MSSVRRVVSWVVPTALIVVGVALLFNRQNIVDQIAYADFQPTDEVAAMVGETGMSDTGKFYFYSSRPEVADSDVFNNSCERRAATSPVLGCYLAADSKIYVYDVTDANLQGIKGVTAAHEMLHAAYDRLSESKRAWLEPRLEAAYKRLQTDKLKTRMDYYAEADPSSRVNELHSILATEFSDLGPELEGYYERYFSNRKLVVELYEGYSGQFFALEEESRTLSDQLKIDLVDVEMMSDQYEADVSKLNASIEDFNQKAKSSYFSSREQFDSARGVLLGENARLEARRDQLGQKIGKYNADVEKLNALGLKIDKLNKSIDSLEEIK